jgi:hypothetical protein
VLYPLSYEGTRAEGRGPRATRAQRALLAKRRWRLQSTIRPLHRPNATRVSRALLDCHELHLGVGASVHRPGVAAAVMGYLTHLGGRLLEVRWSCA